MTNRPMKTAYYLVALLFGLCINIYSQSFDFLHINNTDGLSNNQIECIFKDSKGFMWFGTNSGLNRYDGRNFKIFKHSRYDVNSAPIDRFTNIQEDVNGNLWLYYNGMSYFIYNSKSEKFIVNVLSLIHI